MQLIASMLHNAVEKKVIRQANAVPKLDSSVTIDMAHMPEKSSPPNSDWEPG